MTTAQEFTREALIASSNFGPVRKTETIAVGADLKRGTLLARKADGKMEAYASGKTAIGILLDDATAAAADTQAVCGFAGVYVKKNVIGLDAAAETALEARSIYFR